MFSLPAVEVSSKARWGAGLWLAEIIATFGLVLVISTVRDRSKRRWSHVPSGLT
jgi:glycerol uptake facilitator-like aquaporin